MSSNGETVDGSNYKIMFEGVFKHPVKWLLKISMLDVSYRLSRLNF